MKTNTIKTWTMLLLIAVLTGCGKDGETGPQGPQGQQGEKGDQGSPGTANIIYSDWIEPSANSYNGENTARSKQMNRVISQITTDIANNGVVLMFVQEMVFGRIYQLPYSKIGTNGAVDAHYSHTFQSSGYRIFVKSFTRDLLASEYTYISSSSGVRFRYVIIPGGTSLSASATSVHGDREKVVQLRGGTYTQSDLREMSYTDIQKLIDIPD